MSTLWNGIFFPISSSTLSRAIGLELERLSMTTVSCPAALSSINVCDPIYPVPPVTNILILLTILAIAVYSSLQNYQKKKKINIKIVFLLKIVDNT